MTIKEFLDELTPEAKSELKLLEEKHRLLEKEVEAFVAKHPPPRHHMWGWSGAGTLRPWFYTLE